MVNEQEVKLREYNQWLKGQLSTIEAISPKLAKAYSQFIDYPRVIVSLSNTDIVLYSAKIEKDMFITIPQFLEVLKTPGQFDVMNIDGHVLPSIKHLESIDGLSKEIRQLAPVYNSVNSHQAKDIFAQDVYLGWSLDVTSYFYRKTVPEVEEHIDRLRLCTITDLQEWFNKHEILTAAMASQRLMRPPVMKKTQYSYNVRLPLGLLNSATFKKCYASLPEARDKHLERKKELALKKERGRRRTSYPIRYNYSNPQQNLKPCYMYEFDFDQEKFTTRITSINEAYDFEELRSTMPPKNVIMVQPGYNITAACYFSPIESVKHKIEDSNTAHYFMYYYRTLQGDYLFSGANNGKPFAYYNIEGVLDFRHPWPTFLDVIQIPREYQWLYGQEKPDTRNWPKLFIYALEFSKPYIVFKDWIKAMEYFRANPYDARFSTSCPVNIVDKDVYEELAHERAEIESKRIIAIQDYAKAKYAQEELG